MGPKNDDMLCLDCIDPAKSNIIHHHHHEQSDKKCEVERRRKPVCAYHLSKAQGSTNRESNQSYIDIVQ